MTFDRNHPNNTDSFCRDWPNIIDPVRSDYRTEQICSVIPNRTLYKMFASKGRTEFEPISNPSTKIPNFWISMQCKHQFFELLIQLFIIHSSKNPTNQIISPKKIQNWIFMNQGKEITSNPLSGSNDDCRRSLFMTGGGWEASNGHSTTIYGFDRRQDERKKNTVENDENGWAREMKEGVADNLKIWKIIRICGG